MLSKKKHSFIVKNVKLLLLVPLKQFFGRGLLDFTTGHAFKYHLQQWSVSDTYYFEVTHIPMAAHLLRFEILRLLIRHMIRKK